MVVTVLGDVGGKRGGLFRERNQWPPHTNSEGSMFPLWGRTAA